MQTDNNKNLVRKYYEEIVNTGNLEGIEEYISPDYTEVIDGKRYEAGIQGAREHIIGVRRTYPDLHITIENQIAEGEWVATSVTARGTHKGEWLGIKPTGRKLTFTGVNIERIVNNRIVEHGGAANMLGPLLAAGAVQVVGRVKSEAPDSSL